MRRLLGRGSVLTIALAAIVCLSPVRFDAKALGPTLPSTTDGPIAPGTSILFVSPEDGGRYGHVAEYGLDLVSFPHGRTAWLVFSEGHTEGAWPPDYLLTPEGDLLGRTAGAWAHLDERPPRLADIVASGLVLVASVETRDRLIDRWPGLDAGRVRVLSDRRPSVLGRPGLRMTGAVILRLGILCLILTGAWLFAWRLPVAVPALRWLNVGLALPLVLAIHAGLVHMAGLLTTRALATALAIELTLILLAFARQDRQLKAGQAAQTLPRWSVPVVAVFLVVFVLRLDFDGDLFTHWLPMARSHHLLGRHDIPALLDRYGLAHEATYPPGFPILISTLLWVAGADPGTSLQLGDESHAAILLYRLLLATLSLSFLVAAAALASALFRDRTSPLFPLIALPLLIPVFLGQPTSGEVYLVPLLGASILALWAGDAFESAALTRVGLLLAASGLFVKREALVIVPLLVLPWYLAGALRRRKAAAGDLVVAGLALVPFAAWRIQLGALHLRENFMFDDPAWGRLANPLLLRLGGQALKTILANGTWIVLFLVLPAAALWSARRHRWRELLVPAGIALYAPLMAVVYVFSRSDPFHHMETSYERLLMVAVLSAALYGLRNLALAQPSPADPPPQP